MNILSKFQLPSSNGLGVFQRSGTKGLISYPMNEWMDYKGVYKTALATPGVVKSI